MRACIWQRIPTGAKADNVQQGPRAKLGDPSFIIGKLFLGKCGGEGILGGVEELRRWKEEAACLTILLPVTSF